MYDVNQMPYEVGAHRVESPSLDDLVRQAKQDGERIAARVMGGVPKGAATAVRVAQRIADLSKQLTEAGFELEAARSACREADARRAQWETTFANLSGALMQAIQEHREGTPEGVPYPGGPLNRAVGG